MVHLFKWGWCIFNCTSYHSAGREPNIYQGEGETAYCWPPAGAWGGVGVSNTSYPTQPWIYVTLSNTVYENKKYPEGVY